MHKKKIYLDTSVISYLKQDDVRSVCLANNISPIDIYTPPVLLERNDFDG